MLIVKSIEAEVLRVKKLAEIKLAKNENVDEFVPIAEADGFKSMSRQARLPKAPYLGISMKTRETFSCSYLKEKWSSRSRTVRSKP